MSKKTDKYTGMNDMFLEQEIAEKTAAYETARAKLEAELEDFQRRAYDYDSGLSSIEDRNEINSLKYEIHELEQRYNQEIAKIKSKQK